MGIVEVVRDVLGFEALHGLSRDAILLLLMKALRMYAFGYVAVILFIYLQAMGYSDVDIGGLFTLTMVGDMFISLLLTTRADVWGRKATLLVGAGLSVMTSVVFSQVTQFWALVVAATVGVISPSGNEVGPFQGVEVSCLAQVTDDLHRTRLMAWYNLFGYVACASGALCCGFTVHTLMGARGYTLFQACQAAMIAYSGIKVACPTPSSSGPRPAPHLTPPHLTPRRTQLVLVYLILLLSPAVEVPPRTSSTASAAVSTKVGNPVSLFLGLHKSRGIVLQLSGLFIIDAFAGSFIMQSIITAWYVTAPPLAPSPSRHHPLPLSLTHARVSPQGSTSSTARPQTSSGACSLCATSWRA